jgi:hypothetical protein
MKLNENRLAASCFASPGWKTWHFGPVNYPLREAGTADANGSLAMKAAANTIADRVLDQLLPWISFVIFTVAEVLFVYGLFRLFLPR